MIDLPVSVSRPFGPATRSRRDDSFVIVSATQTAPTILDYGLFFERFVKADYSAATFGSAPIKPLEEEELFVSPVIRAINIISPIIVGGSVVQPPLDDELVYFDE